MSRRSNGDRPATEVDREKGENKWLERGIGRLRAGLLMVTVVSAMCTMSPETDGKVDLLLHLMAGREDLIFVLLFTLSCCTAVQVFVNFLGNSLSVGKTNLRVSC